MLAYHNCDQMLHRSKRLQEEEEKKEKLCVKIVISVHFVQ